MAILAGFIIFPAAFSVGIQPDAGPSLIFITLPNVFQQAFSGIPILAYIFSVMFYVLLAVAALTSTISMHEVVTAYLHEEFKFTRKRAAQLVTGGCIFLGIFCSLSLGVTKTSPYSDWVCSTYSTLSLPKSCCLSAGYAFPYSPDGISTRKSYGAR